METIRVFVGADRSQSLAIRVLEHSIKRHTDRPVEVIPMVDLDVPAPRNPKQRQRTGFSFSRFCIPRLAGYQGRAVYMDADMLVMKDFGKLWDIPMNGNHVLVQEELGKDQSKGEKLAAPKKRIKQSAVMVIDCEKCQWKIEDIVADLDADKYTYEDLVFHLCLVPEEKIGYQLPFEWNSLETLNSGTCNIHYTDMPTQPWVSARNANDPVWLNEVRMMLQSGQLTQKELQNEIRLGYFRPSLWLDVRHRPKLPQPLMKFWRESLNFRDQISGYVAHRATVQANRNRMQVSPT